MRAIRRFTVHPVLPEPLQPLEELARNLLWYWNEPTKELFRAMDPALWEATGQDPRKLLSRIDARRLAALAEDSRFTRKVAHAYQDLTDYLTLDRWYQDFAAQHPGAPERIAYFSAEFGVSEVLPQYSGGLGILAGDHLKAASDSGIPIIGVGLLYRHGYFRQYLDAQGWQQERYPLLAPFDLPLTLLTENGEAVTVEVPLRQEKYRAQIWVAQVGRVPLLMLDALVDGNSEAAKAVTDRLYGGGVDHRLAQEVLLGIGGVRALREYCRISGDPAPTVYHANEGHAGFLGLERIREYMNDGIDFATAVELTRAGSLFTTHTPVPAGIDRFPRDLVADQFRTFAPLPLDRIMAFGTEDYVGGDRGVFNMAVLGFRLGQRANGVSELHGAVSRRMFQGLWPSFDVSEVPITSVTNGVHHKTWIHPELLELLESPTSDSDTVIDGYDWSGLDRVDDNTIWALKQQMRGGLVRMARERLAASAKARGLSGSTEWVERALDPNILTFGFARRAASYKRLTLMLRDPERLKRLLNHPERPIQIVIAGKAHPADNIGKGLIQEMVRFADAADVRERLVFLPDYDMSLARPLYPGCDVWINNPLRPQEACGTSGMKAAMNGAANLSVRDGWWDEWYDPKFGWEIPSVENLANADQRDAQEAAALYEIIENEIVPRFYTRDSNGMPTAWIAMIRDIMSGLTPKILASRMVREYTERMYLPTARSSARMAEGRTAQETAAWKQRIRTAWPQVSVSRVEGLDSASHALGSQVSLHAVVRLGELTPDDVEVQMVMGRVDDNDEIHDIVTYPARAGDAVDGGVRYGADVRLETAGSVGVTCRVVPSREGLATIAEMGLATVSAD
ncbi:alpha-glucan family phosphorylase [Raineyella fluvialis]|uniref:glycogen phosphorylase n=1 Tax=Raineyella fluvialis TaxID=2662261 RepID=A0A5Q2FG42_9ACTN|nr:alpha-glucan family phosphorylase [Raineyella fluvialis]QGF24474.1 alpha-glucan family phosphorylase [Raineyella fluvialis]